MNRVEKGPPVAGTGPRHPAPLPIDVDPVAVAPGGLRRFPPLTTLALASALVAAVPIAAAAATGQFSRYLADDFCTAGALRRFGFWGSQVYWFENWSGRYAFTFGITTAHSFGPGLTPWLTLAALLLACGAGVYFFRGWLAELEDRVAIPISIGLAGLLVLVTLQAAPDLYQSLYWQTGMMTYFFPLILATFYFGWLRRGAPSGAAGGRAIPAPILSALFAFVAGGFSETFVVLQTVLLGIITAAVGVDRSVTRPKGTLGIVAAGLLGSLIALAVVAMAPGNAVRQSAFSAPTDLIQVLTRSAGDEYLFVARLAKGFPFSVLLANALPAIFGFWAARQSGLHRLPRRDRRPPALSLMALPLVTAGLVLVTFVPYEYVESSYPDGRVLITTLYVLLVGMISWALMLGVGMGRWLPLGPDPAVGRVLAGVAILVVGLGAWVGLQTTKSLLEDYTAAQEYASAWDQRDESLRRAHDAGMESLAAPSLRHMGGLAELGRDPEEWINRCIAWTYGLDQVVAK